MEFSLGAGVGNNDPVALPATLMLSMHNQTVNPTEFDIAEMAFNAPDTVTGMSLISLTSGNQDWTLAFDNTPGGGFNVNGFGSFDVSLVDSIGEGNGLIVPDETEVFEIQLDGAGLITELDFITEFSEIITTGQPMLAAAKFIHGPGDASAFGATNVPEPSSLVLLTLGGLFIARRRR
jgi:hypothetical protein